MGRQLLVAGTYCGPTAFGTNQLTTADGESNAGFLAKCDSNGNFLWATQTTANNNASWTSVTVDSTGNAYVCGVTPSSKGFLKKYDANGNSLWQLTPTSSGYARSYGTAVDRSNRVALVTWATGRIAFDAFSYTNIGGNDIFVGQVYEQIPPVFVTQPISSPAGFLAGTPNTFTCSTRSLYPVAYQWQFNGTNIAGATTTSLIISNAQTSDAGLYQVIASNEYGATTSTVVNLTIYFTLNLIIDGTGSVATAPNGAVAEPGNLLCYSNNSVVTLTAVTNPAFAFTGWSGDVFSASNPITIPVTTNLYIVARFSDSTTNIIITTWTTSHCLAVPGR